MFSFQRFLRSLQPARDWGPAHKRYTVADDKDMIKEREAKNGTKLLKEQMTAFI